MTILDPSARSAAPFLVGRREDLSVLHALVRRRASVVLRGEAGVGKTALLDFVAEVAPTNGVQVLRAAGAEPEIDVRFSGLNQVLLPLLDELAQLTDDWRGALEVALGFVGGPPVDLTLASDAALALLRTAGGERPLLLVIDDLQWLDPASAIVLAFVARRLGDSGAALLGARRSGVACPFADAGIAEHEVLPLDEESAAELVTAHHPTMAPRLRRQVLAEARGNPLALLELPTAISRRQQMTPGAIPTVLPLSRRLRAIFSGKVTGLPAATRQLLLEAALDPTGGDELPPSLAGVRAAELAPAEDARLVRVDPTTGRLTFRHPLTRAAVVDLSTTDERRRVHRRLADRRVDQPERRAWHLAEATVEPDEAVAAALEEAGRRMLQRSDAPGAVAAWTRAASLSPRASDRSRRLAEAAFVSADVTGELEGASQLLVDAKEADPFAGTTLQAAVTAAYIVLMRDGDVDATMRLLTGAIEATTAAAAAPDCARREALATLLRAGFLGARRDLWQPYRDVVAESDPALATPLGLSAAISADPARATPAQLDQLDAALASLEDEGDPTRIERVATAALFVDRAHRCHDALWRVVRDGRNGGAVAASINALAALALDDFQAGHWDSAQDLAAEGIELCSVHGYGPQLSLFHYVHALRAAVRGDAATTTGLTDAMIQWAVPRGADAVRHLAMHARALSALGRSDHDEAFRCAAAISSPGSLPPMAQPAPWVVLDLVEAALRTDRRAEAVAHVRAMRATNLGKLSPRIAMLATASAALVEPDEAARQLFAQALAIPGIERWPFDVARVHLLFGERLRRARATNESRQQLDAARSTFERLGARPWADRARAELRATCRPMAEPVRAGLSTLTGQESTIATLAARGMTNKMIAVQLHVSHRTVSAHLYRVFQKLGITSRAALRDALPAAD